MVPSLTARLILLKLNFGFDLKSTLIKEAKGPFKYYVIKEVGGWGQKMAIFDDL